MSDNRLKKPYVEALKEIEKLKKEIKTLKEQALTWGEHARESQQAARGIEKEFEKSKAAHEKQVHQMSGEINRQINKVANAEKERDELSEIYSGNITEAEYRITVVEKESDALKEQLARTSGALRKWKEFFESDRGGRGVSSFDRVCWVKGNKALSSYDPKWLEGVRAEARDGIVDYLALKFAENGPVGMAHDIRKLWENLKAVRQPNQSREKMG